MKARTIDTYVLCSTTLSQVYRDHSDALQVYAACSIDTAHQGWQHGAEVRYRSPQFLLKSTVRLYGKHFFGKVRVWYVVWMRILSILYHASTLLRNKACNSLTMLRTVFVLVRCIVTRGWRVFWLLSSDCLFPFLPHELKPKGVLWVEKLQTYENWYSWILF